MFIFVINFLLQKREFLVKFTFFLSLIPKITFIMLFLLIFSQAIRHKIFINFTPRRLQYIVCNIDERKGIY